MSDNENKYETIEAVEEIVPAKLVDGEAIIPEEKIEVVKEAVKEILKTKETKEDTSKKEDVIVVPESEDLTPGLGPVADGVMGTSLVSKTEKSKVSPSKPRVDGVDKVAIFSTKNVSWAEVNGKVYRGYNIVKKEAADMWLTKDFIRLATPEEVAREFGL
jgi:hypothetical protein